MNKHLVRALAAFICIPVVAAAWLFVPPPGPARSQFIDQSTYGGTSGGSTNAQTITIGNYTGHLPGVVLRFIPNSPNTGPTTINVSGLGAVAIVRPSSIGNVALSGGELQSGELTCITYNGTAYQLACNVDMTPIGRTVEYRGAAVPRGALVEDGTAVSRTTYAALFSVIGTIYGAGDGSTTFNLPLSNGTVFGALDNQGSATANRITSAGSGCNATVVGFCGLQNATLSIANINAFTPTVSSTSFTAGTASIPVANLTSVGGATDTNRISLKNNANTDAGLLTAGTSVSGTVGVVMNSLGSGTPHPVLNPILLGRRAIKY